MQTKTKELFKKLKELRPILHSITEYYGISYDTNEIVERYYLEYPNKHFSFNTEKELQDEIKKLIVSTASEFGFAYPHTVAKLKLNDEEKI